MTAYELATRYVGIKEVPGIASNPEILKMLQLDNKWVEDDATPWCSAFVNYICWQLRLPRSRSLAARSWLKVGAVVPLSDAQKGNDVVILTRGAGAPPANVLDAPGHVGLFAGMDGQYIYLLGGNQHDEVNVSPYDPKRLLGVRRLIL